MEELKRGLYDSSFEHDACGVGFVCNIKGVKSHTVIDKGILALEHLEHRGAVGADPKTGDGAGISIQLPDEFLRKSCAAININLPPKEKYAAGLVFLPNDKKERKFCKIIFTRTLKTEGLGLLGWREVPVNDSVIGRTAKQTQPFIAQVFVACPDGLKDEAAFERKLYIARKQIEAAVRSSNLSQRHFFYITNISCRTLIYKGLLMSSQLKEFFPDLKDNAIASSFALIHARYSTNTFPTWDLAQPFRYLAHNGEINTLRGNINWMHAREGQFTNGLFGKDIKKIPPIIVPGGSDSANLDNALELLVLAGRSLPHAMMMLIPEAWQQNPHIEEKRKSFYEYHACLMEPWDGPAAIAFTDGRFIGATLDRNGLRSARYCVGKDDMLVMASEAGVLDVAAEDIIVNGRLEPGKMFLVDTLEGRIIDDGELKDSVSSRRQYTKWLKGNLKTLESLSMKDFSKPPAAKNPVSLQKAFGFSREDLNIIMKPMAIEGVEPTGSMGDDTPLAALSAKPRLLYDYFKQLFAQVTNPAIDPIREELVMSVDTYLGREENILSETPRHCRRLKIKHPILTDEELGKIRCIRGGPFKTKTISLLLKAGGGENGFKAALDRVCRETTAAIKSGYAIIILSDRGVDKNHAALPALLAVGAVHHHLLRNAMRTRVSIIVESAEPREIAHVALLFGYGADCINLYLAYEAIKNMVEEKELELSFGEAQKNYIKALEKGILKVLSKMGISTLQSYRGAQIFEALGLSSKVVEKCFTGTASRIEGIGLDVIAEETLKRHSDAFGPITAQKPILPSGGLYQWRAGGELHLWNPDTIFLLQQAARNNDMLKYREFANFINNQTPRPVTLRGLLKFCKKLKPVPIEEVEPVSDIIKRFVTGAMSFGSISRQTHETIALAMNKLGAKSNSGEGGEDPQRFNHLSNGESLRSSIKQVASGRFGVTINYLVNADELQIKIAQGAKPGEGGQLPGHKVSATIARTRYTTPGVTLISPPPHHDIYSIEDLAQLIFDLKNANPSARISVKLVSEAGVGTVAAGVAKGHADTILISGGDGGTGASPLSSIKHAGLPWELGLSETHQTLVLNDLRSRVRLQTDGQMRTGRDVVIATLLGAEEYGFATPALITLGCVMLRHCHLNNCSLGIATQQELLCKRFSGKPEYLENYFRFVAGEVREIMAELGIRKIDELIGRTDLLELNRDALNWKTKGLDFSRILYQPKLSISAGRHCTKKQGHGITAVLDLKLIALAKEALEKKHPVSAAVPINNSNRSVGAMLSGEVIRHWGEEGLPEGAIHFKFTGTAGQSFGAFLARGITLKLEGSANDYVGKGLSGGKIIIYPPRKTNFKSDKNIIIGNTTFYGATGGEAYIMGVAGERFCIRNSGIYATVEGVGDHGCEYMTGGRVVILGETGRNFAAGMSGGIAYVYDVDKHLHLRCNLSMVALEEPSADDELIIRELLAKHYLYTSSPKAKKLLVNFRQELNNFVKVMPVEYKRVLEGAAEKELVSAEVSDG
ncbi:MAG: glutamate synthase large subunit [Candidatus Omnitrophota bacterium]